MTDLRYYTPLFPEGREIIGALKEMVDWVNQSALNPSEFTWVLRYADIQKDAPPLDPLLQCGKFAKLLPFQVDYENGCIPILQDNEEIQKVFNELIWGIGGNLTVWPKDGGVAEYRVHVSGRVVLVEYFYELIEGHNVECLTISVLKPEGK